MYDLFPFWSLKCQRSLPMNWIPNNYHWIDGTFASCDQPPTVRVSIYAANRIALKIDTRKITISISNVITIYTHVARQNFHAFWFIHRTILEYDTHMRTSEKHIKFIIFHLIIRHYVHQSKFTVPTKWPFNTLFKLYMRINQF